MCVSDDPVPIDQLDCVLAVVGYDDIVGKV